MGSRARWADRTRRADRGPLGGPGPAGGTGARSLLGAAQLSDDGGTRDRRRLNRAIKDGLRDVGAQLTRLNHGVGGRLDLKASDLEVLDVIARSGQISPTALSRRTGQHPATLTGILDRLERGSWIVRERDPADRRGVVVSADRSRGAAILRLYLVDSGMNAALDEILAGYGDGELAIVADFLRRTAEAGRTSADRLQSAE
jgi:DNA-binding MarR family transcriptional regulator